MFLFKHLNYFFLSVSVNLLLCCLWTNVWDVVDGQVEGKLSITVLFFYFTLTPKSTRASWRV